MLAAVGIGWFESIADTLAMNPTHTLNYENHPEVKLIYDAAYAIYDELREAPRSIWKHNIRPLNKHRLY